jgi:hypothetical protein
MKRWKITVLAICLIAGSAFAEIAKDPREAAVADMLRRLAAAEEIVIDDLSAETKITREVAIDGVTRWVEEPPPIRSISLKEKGEVQEFAASLSPSVHMLREGVALPADASGAERIIYPLCQCLGDYGFRIITNKKEVLRFTIHHEGEFIRVGSGESLDEFDLAPPSGRRITEIAREALKRANQSLQRNAGSRPSSMNSPASETPSALGPRG